MIFKTLSEYGDEIKRYDRMIDNHKKYYERHPEDIGGHTNHEVLIYIRNELQKERDKLAASSYCDELSKKIEEDYGFCQAEKSMKPLNDIISSITEEEYNEDFINEMENIGQEKSIPIEGQLRGEITLLKECRSKVCQQLVEEQEKNMNRQTFLNDLYEAIDEHYTETLKNNDELAIARADAQLQLIKEIIDRVEKI